MRRTGKWTILELAVVVGVTLAAIVAIPYGILNSMAGTERQASEAALREKIVAAAGDIPVESYRGQPVEGAAEAKVTGDEVSPAAPSQWEQVLHQFCEQGAFNRTRAGAIRTLGHKAGIAMACTCGETHEVDTPNPVGTFSEAERDILAEAENLCWQIPLAELSRLIPVDCPRCTKDDVHYPYEIHIMQCSAMLATYAVVHAYEGRHGEALPWLSASLEMDATMPPTEREGTYPMPEWAFQELVRAAFLDREIPWGDLAPLLETMARIGARGEFAKEVAVLGNDFSRYVTYYPSYTMSDGAIQRAVGRVYVRAGSPVIHGDVSMYARSMARLIELAPLPYIEAAPDLARIQTTPSTWRPGNNPDNLSDFLVRLREQFLPQAYGEALVGMAQVAMALEAHREASGSYPETLEALTNAFPDGFPRDPFAEGTFRYAPLGEFYTLYSLGPNLSDEGGIHGLPHNMVSEENDADYVWCGGIRAAADGK